mmetsp:Transcript_3147/g.4840  ORF Transcript_3147/g.4840 Transcript_3147/m.4840 type:complete len:87 (-) Transcript_3147:9-269(-)
MLMGSSLEGVTSFRICMRVESSKNCCNLWKKRKSENVTCRNRERKDNKTDDWCPIAIVDSGSGKKYFYPNYLNMHQNRTQYTMVPL